MSEYHKFAVDAIAQAPESKLDYIALDNTVEYIIRRAPTKKVAVNDNGKGKAKEKKQTLYHQLASMESTDHFDGITLAPTLGMLIDGYDDSDDDEAFGTGAAKGLKAEGVIGERFCEINNIRIFQNDVLLGRL
jgi:hypothetical protein